jgi:hypothetical protein
MMNSSVTTPLRFVFCVRSFKGRIRRVFVAEVVRLRAVVVNLKSHDFTYGNCLLQSSCREPDGFEFPGTAFALVAFVSSSLPSSRFPMRTRLLTQNLANSNRRRGVVTLEVILLLPILVILLLAVIEFGLIMAAAQHVEAATRLGAKFAAESNNLPVFNAPSMMDNLKERVDQYLNTAGYTDSCQVILEHNVMGMGNLSQLNPLGSPCSCTPEPGPIGSLPAGSVRVTVCLSLSGNVPNVLDMFGFDISNRSLRQSVVWAYEDP